MSLCQIFDPCVTGMKAAALQNSLHFQNLVPAINYYSLHLESSWSLKEITGFHGMEITAASGRVPVQMWLREVYTVFLLISSLATSVGLLIWSAVILWVLFGWFLNKALGFRHNWCKGGDKPCSGCFLYRLSQWAETICLGKLTICSMFPLLCVREDELDVVIQS